MALPCPSSSTFQSVSVSAPLGHLLDGVCWVCCHPSYMCSSPLQAVEGSPACRYSSENRKTVLTIPVWTLCFLPLLDQCDDLLAHLFKQVVRFTLFTGICCQLSSLTFSQGKEERNIILGFLASLSPRCSERSLEAFSSVNKLLATQSQITFLK